MNVFIDAAVAGVRTGDHLIEINGENIENISDEQVKQRIRVVQYPQPLQLLVCDQATYDRYKSQGKIIHSGLPNIDKSSTGVIERPVSFSRVPRGLFSFL